MLPETQVLGERYELLERVGSGGMATVYKARDRTLGRLVAVKLLHAPLTSDEAFLRSFRHEAHAAANLSHPNIVMVHDIGRDDGQYFIVMELVEGQTLKEIIRKQAQTGRAMPTGRAIDLAVQICAGIGYAHRAGFVHCDVKPQNILVTRDDRVKITDFGIARAVSDASQEIRSVVWGTPQYLSPEQAAGRSASPSSDVYAIGVIIFELLTNRLPFHAESQTALAYMHLHEPAPPVSMFNGQVPPQLSRIVSKILSKEPAGRYRTAGQLERILRTYQKQGAGAGPAAPEPSPVFPAGEAAVPSDEMPTRVWSERTAITSADAAGDSIPVMVPAPDVGGTDWIAVGLGLLALAALLGLIPLWWLVYQAWLG